ncbi:MAG TPA: DUF6326 family protein [Salinivirgaceae bacterium]|nr:DUF6326 family protein [Salinivirgaceae bacterium]HQA76612.1 DUF6326 family protein [Salinivirgaceae bacterium]
MTNLKISVLGLSLALLCSNLSAQQVNVADSLITTSLNSDFSIMHTESHAPLDSTDFKNIALLAVNSDKIELSNLSFQDRTRLISDESVTLSLQNEYLDLSFQENLNKNLSLTKDNFFEKNRRNIYSSVWAFASLNYLYCDLVAFMDKDFHAQYHTGDVGGMKMTPEFLTGAALMMQIPIANVFLPQVIKNDRTLKWVQFASGLAMTLIQSATLFSDKPTPYYAAFSALEIGATAFITIDALRWKTDSKKKIPAESY